MQCQYVKNDHRCEANALKGSIHCFYHSDDPEVVKMREEAAIKGGKNSRGQKYEPVIGEFEIKTSQDATKLLNILVNEIIAGRMSEKMGTSLGFLINAILKSLEQQEISNKIKNIQNVLEPGK